MITTTLAKFETRVNDFPVCVTLEHNDVYGFYIVYGSKGNVFYYHKNLEFNKAVTGYETIKERYKAKARQDKVGFTETFTDYYFSPEKIQS